MQYVDINTLEIVSRQHIVAQYPETSFPPDLTHEILEELDYLPIEEDERPELSPGEALVPGEVRIENDRAIRGWVVIPAMVPQSVSRARGKAALLAAGMLDAVEGFINTLEGGEKTLALLAFNETNEWRRDSPFLNQAATALGVTQEQMDELFLEASKIAL